jgi:hypothetical protein
MKRKTVRSRQIQTGMGIVMLALGALPSALADEAGRIQPYSKNPFYWQYQGKPVLLLGGSDDDNLFQWERSALIEQLDRLVAVGGNVIRNTMSDRPDRGFEVSPFMRRSDGKFDLGRWNDEYWRRFETLLELTAERKIIVQIEIWDMWDMHAEGWLRNPWNPANNVNYPRDDTQLAADYVRPTYRDGTSHGRPHDFFLTVPTLNHDPLVLSHQQRFVDKLLSYSLRFGHLLYCISNEIHPQYPPEWGWYWAGHLRQQASNAGRGIEVTEMFWIFDLMADQHRASLDHPGIYSFFEASQNSAILDPEAHWRNLGSAYQYLSSRPRPINNTKIYGADDGPVWSGTTQNAQEKFWRNIFGGSASSRFHRPPAGLGLSEAARPHIQSLRRLTDAMHVFACKPRNDLLDDREPNEAYCLAEPGRQYAVYFPDGGTVSLDVSDARGSLELRWLDITRSVWQEPQSATAGRTLELRAPDNGHWAVLIVARP